jgi:hypothetical protein
VGGCPLPPAQQRDLGVDEASKVCDRQAALPSANSVQWRARPTRNDRGRSAIRAVRSGYASPSIWARMGRPPGHGRRPWPPSRAVLSDRRPEPEATARGKRFAEIRLCGVWHTAPARGGFAAVTTPACRHRPPRARFSLRADAWPPRPQAAQPNLNPSDTTPIPTEYKGVEKAAFGYAQNVLTLSRFRRTSSNGGELAPVGDTGSRARRGRR